MLPIACRLCLMENLSGHYINLMEYSSWEDADSILNALGVDMNLFDMSLYPGHICNQCENTVKNFINLKNFVKTHEAIIIEHQDKIRRFGTNLLRQNSNVINVEKDLSKSSDKQRNAILKWVRIDDLNRQDIEVENNTKNVTDENIKEHNYPGINKNKVEHPMITYHNNDDKVSIDHDKQNICTRNINNDNARMFYTDKMESNKNINETKLETEETFIQELVNNGNRINQSESNEKPNETQLEKEEAFLQDLVNNSTLTIQKVIILDGNQKSNPEFSETSNNLLEPTISNDTCPIDTKTGKQDLTIKTKFSSQIQSIKKEICELDITKDSLLKNDDMPLSPNVDERVNVKKIKYMAECPVCSKKMKNDWMKRHLATHNQVKNIPCTYSGCKVLFSNEMYIKKHVNVIHLGKKQLCMQCGEKCKNLKYHILRNHSNKKFPCDKCEKVFQYAIGLTQHLNKTHNAERKKSLCNFCPSQVYEMEKHIQLQHAEIELKILPCPNSNCNKKFKNNQEVKKHNDAVHLGLKFPCPYCSNIFKNVQVHISEAHNSATNKTCDVCRKVFRNKYELKIHTQRVHEGRVYRCSECGKTISKIKEHLNLVHLKKGSSLQEAVKLSIAFNSKK